jgi:hypothetical protein
MLIYYVSENINTIRTNTGTVTGLGCCSVYEGRWVDYAMRILAGEVG